MLYFGKKEGYGFMEKEFERILKAHFDGYPHMMPQDAVKLCYQSEFGCGHFAPSRERAEAYLDEELKELEALPERVNEKPVEIIGGGYVRAYLRPYIENGHERDKLITAFINSANAPHGKREGFIERLELVRSMAESGNAPFSAEEFDGFIAEYRKHWTEKGIPAVHHSEQYRNLYHPAYRVLSASEAAGAGIL